MTAFAVDCQADDIRRGHDRAGQDFDDAAVQAAPDVAADDGVDLGVFERTVLDHRLGAARRFLRRLKDEFDVAGEGFAVLGQQHRRADGGGDVDVMAAGVHFAGSFGFIGDVVQFLDRQGVDVGADRHGFAGLAAAQQGDDAGLGDVSAHFQAEAFH